MESKEHKKKRKLNKKYSYMEKCEIRETRNKPWQLVAAEKMRKKKDEEQKTNDASQKDDEI